MIDSAPAPHEAHQQHLLAWLTDSPPQSAQQLAAYAQMSQPTVSRTLAALGHRILRLGAARSTRYALKKDILGLGATQLLNWDDRAQASDTPQPFGRLTYLHDDWLHVQSGAHEWLSHGQLPWFLTPLRPQGFLGRQLRRLRPDFADNPDDWTLEQVLYMAASHIREPVGAFWLGEPTGRLVEEVSQSLELRLRQYDERAVSIGQNLPAYSSAGGEQPKFTAEFAGDQAWQHVIVKFSPPRGTPFGERWKALLMLEALALDVLHKHGIAVAKAKVLHSEQRTYLESVRFDRVGMEGKSHVVAIDALHQEFTPGSREHWVRTAEGLLAKKLITPGELSTIASLHAFGHFIGNTDMHFGNLSFFVDDVLKPKIRLAPVYDMLPMMWRPTIYGELSDSPLREVRLPAGYTDEHESARQWALVFWERAARLDIGKDLQNACTESARRLAARFT